MQRRWYSLDRRFMIAAGDDALPAPPITGKAQGSRRQPGVLQRTGG
ncbi:hypothetical protein [Ramlibacter sp.]|nr:hypothetical protein [Ramlibacter sp.]